jgi:hypothetical protein
VIEYNQIFTYVGVVQVSVSDTAHVNATYKVFFFCHHLRLHIVFVKLM